ncbi:type II toxin-antitoxin system YafQ family toxin [Thermophilibacter sp.]
MRYAIKFDSAFKADYQRVTRQHPRIREELRAAMVELADCGALPDAYRPHVLDNPGGNYNGHIDFHLSDGAVDVVVLYLPHRTNPVIRFVRMGTHGELFQGPER